MNVQVSVDLNDLHTYGIFVSSHRPEPLSHLHGDRTAIIVRHHSTALRYHTSSLHRLLPFFFAATTLKLPLLSSFAADSLAELEGPFFATSLHPPD